MEDKEKSEVIEMAMTKGEVIGLLEAIKIINEMAKDKKEVSEAIARIQAKMEEPNAPKPASETR